VRAGVLTEIDGPAGIQRERRQAVIKKQSMVRFVHPGRDFLHFRGIDKHISS